MERKSKLALAAAAGVVSLFAVTAIAQQASSPPGNKPAAATPAAPAAPNAAPAQGNEKATATRSGSSSAADKGRRWRGHHRHYGRGGHHMRRGEWRARRMARRNRWRNMSETDRKAFFEARLAAIKAGLMLNETQAKLWPFVETAMREMHAKRRAWAERIRKEGRPANPFDRMKRRGDMLADRGAALQKLADAAKPLYDTLSDDQRRRLRVLTRGIRRMARLRAMRRHRMMMRQMHNRRGHWERRGGYHHQNRRGYGRFGGERRL